MTLLISILAITNMAIGYGLAVYLGNGRQPIQITLGRSRKTKAAVATPLEETSEQVPVETDSTPAVEAEVPAEPEKAAPTPEQVPQLDVQDLMPDAGSTLMTEESNEATAPEPAKPEPTATDEPVEELAEATLEETDDEPIVEAPIAEDAGAEAAKTQEEAEEAAIEPPAQEVVSEETEEAEEVAEVIESDEVVPTEEATAEESTEEAVEKEVDDLESLSQQLQSAVADSGDEPEEEAVVTEDVGEDASVESAEATPETEALEGIEAFQTQLKEQQAVAEEPAAETEQSNDPPDVEALAGIDSFREQLAKM